RLLHGPVGQRYLLPPASSSAASPVSSARVFSLIILDCPPKETLLRLVSEFPISSKTYLAKALYRRLSFPYMRHWWHGRIDAKPIAWPEPSLRFWHSWSQAWFCLECWQHRC